MDWKKHTPPIIMAIGIDREKKRERLIIGEEYQVRSLLNGNDSAVVLYDRERELGTFLTEHQAQLDKDWNEGAIHPLVQASKNIMERKKLEAKAGKYLEEKLNPDDPIGYYAAYQCHSWYLDGKGKGTDWFEERAVCLTKSFKQELWADKRYYLMEDLIERMQGLVWAKGSDKDTEARIWYASRKRVQEFVVVTDSFYPAMLYYLNRLKELGFCYCRCSVCGKMFLAASGHHSLCSDTCREEKSLQNRRTSYAKAKKEEYFGACKNTTQRMRNRMNRLMKMDVPEEEKIRVAEAFKSFQKESSARKKTIKSESDSKKYINWLFDQERKFEELCEQ